MTADLVAFLRARLDEDRLVAFEASDGGSGEWIFNPGLTWNSDAGPREAIVRYQGSAQSYVAAVDPIHGKYGTWNARHIARHDPARVLAEVAAKRALVNLHSPRPTSGPAVPVGGKWVETTNLDCITCGGEGRLSPSWPCHTIRYLALPYAGHPDYREEWRP